jgi:hypothetical protein
MKPSLLRSPHGQMAMSDSLPPATPRQPSGRPTSSRAAPPQIVHPILVALGLFVVLAGIGLGIALVTGATHAFNILVCAAFTVLWIAFAVAVAFSPGTLDDVWHAVRRLALVIQAVAWLLFLPIMIGLWIWERPWPVPIRVVLVLALGAWTVFFLYPRG